LRAFAPGSFCEARAEISRGLPQQRVEDVRRYTMLVISCEGAAFQAGICPFYSPI
jgi:hypothetical protein